MDQYYGQQYAIPPHTTQGQDQANTAQSHSNGMSSNAYSTHHPTNGQSAGPTQHFKQEHFDPTAQYGMTSQPQRQSMDIDQSAMYQFGSNDQSMLPQYSSADMNNMEYVPSSDMSNTSISQDMLLQPGAALYGNNGAQQFLGNSVQSMGRMGPAQGPNPINTYANSQNNNYGLTSPISNTTSPMIQNFASNMSIGNQYMPHNMSMNIDYQSQNMTNMMSPTSAYSFAQQNSFQQPPLPPSHMQGFSRRNSTSQEHTDTQRQQQQPPRRRSSYHPPQHQQLNQAQSQTYNSSSDSSRRQSQSSGPLAFANSQSSSQRPQRPTRIPLSELATESSGGPAPGTGVQVPPQNHYVNAYSSSGFDMMSILMRVASRSRPQIDIGRVDLSCAFVVCDIDQHDIPIVYCSDNFERLTGYTKHEILGRNCRFLQAPDGRVKSGIERQYVDDKTVLKLKNAINTRNEVQVSLINYRKGGQPFMNFLTMIPIPWDTDEMKFYIGFQVDLVEQPGSVHTRNQDGTYQVNYQRGLEMPRYVFEPGTIAQPELGSGHSVSRDDVSTAIGMIANGESDGSKRVWDKVLLENSDDVVFVLSLKGLFLYVSPASHTVLEYDPAELTGNALSSVAHPSDIVPVTRELKESTSGASVDIVFRIRRKNNGYMWFEAHGSLHTEQGKGRKSIVLVGRERPVYTLSKNEILAAGGISDTEIWSKLSTSGMFLFVASNCRQLIDRMPSELTGTSMQAIMRPESRADFARILDIAKTGRRAQCKHEIINKRGQVLQAFSTIYPGDASEGSKPTFVVAQTRLLKYTRPAGGMKSQTPMPKLEHSASNLSGSSGGNNISPQAAGPSRNNSYGFGSKPHQHSQSSATLSANPQPSPTGYMHTFETAATYSGQHGLRIGHQDLALAAEENLFDELKTTRSTSWQFELRQMEKHNRLLAEELQGLLAARKKRKRRKTGAVEKDCANCHTRTTPEWRRGPSGKRDLCNSCGLRWAKQQGRISPRTAKSVGSAASSAGSAASPTESPADLKAPHPTVADSIARNQGQTFSESERKSRENERSTEQRRASAGDAARASRRDSVDMSFGKDTEDMDTEGEGDDDQTKGLAKVPKTDGAAEAPPLPSEPAASGEGMNNDLVMGEGAGQQELAEDTSDDDGEGQDQDEPRSPFRHSGFPNMGTELSHSIAENMEGERTAEEAMGHDGHEGSRY